MKNSNTKTPKPPANLSAEGKKLWTTLIEEYSIDDSAGFLLLGTALEAFDDMRAAQLIITRDGPVVKDRWDQFKQHPATLVLRDSRNLMLRSLKALNLDVAPGLPLTGAK